MKRLIITVKEIICRDSQDPKYDEIYFVTATNNQSNISRTIRRIKDDTHNFYNMDIFDGNVDERSPILITAVEQRAIKDNSIAAKMMEQLAAQGLDFAESWLKENTTTTENVWAQIGEFLLTNLIGIVKLVFRDSPLLNKVITEPYLDGIDYPLTYTVKGKSDKRPTYDYEIKITVEYK